MVFRPLTNIVLLYSKSSTLQRLLPFCKAYANIGIMSEKEILQPRQNYIAEDPRAITKFLAEGTALGAVTLDKRVARRERFMEDHAKSLVTVKAPRGEDGKLVEETMLIVNTAIWNGEGKPGEDTADHLEKDLGLEVVAHDYFTEPGTPLASLVDTASANGREIVAVPLSELWQRDNLGPKQAQAAGALILHSAGWHEPVDA